jgi:hypothetical protein
MADGLGRGTQVTYSCFRRTMYSIHIPCGTD